MKINCIARDEKFKRCNNECSIFFCENHRKQGIIFGLSILGFLLTIPSLYLDIPEATDKYFSEKEDIIENIFADTTDSFLNFVPTFPSNSNSDSLFVLITRFEDYIPNSINEECIGESIYRRIDFLKDSLSLPVEFRYDEKIASPKDLENAKKVRDFNNSDIVIWGLVQNFTEACGTGDICFRSTPSDKMISNAGGQIANPKKNDLNYEKNISPIEIETGELHIGDLSFDRWFLGMVQVKVSEKQPDFYIIDNFLPKDERAKELFIRSKLFSNLNLFDKAIEDISRAVEIIPDHIEGFKERASLLSKKDNFDLAEKDYSKIISLEPNKIENYQLHGSCLIKLNRFDEAYKSFEKVIQLNPKNVKNNIDIFVRPFNNNSFQFHQKCYEKLISIDSTNYFLIRRAKFYRSSKRNNLAEKDFTKLIELEPLNSDYYNERASHYVSMNQHEKALSDYDKAIQVDSLNFTLYDNRAKYHEKQKRNDLAEKDYTKKIQLDSQNITHYKDRAIFYSRINKDSLAEEDYTKIIQLDPLEYIHYIERGHFYEGINKKDVATEDYNKAIQLHPSNFNLYRNRAKFYEKNKEYNLAIKDYTKCIELDTSESQPRSNYLYYKRAQNYERIENYKLAEKDFTKYIELCKFTKGYRERGQFYERRKRYDLAESDFFKHMELRSSLRDYEVRAKFYENIKKYDLAELDYNKIIELSHKRNLGQQYLKRAEFYRKIKKYDLAELDFAKAIEKNPKSDSPYLKRAEFYTSIKKYDLAALNYAKIIELRPNAASYIKRASFYETVERYNLADLDYAEAINLSPSYGVPYFNRARINYLFLKDYRKVVDDLSEVISLSKENKIRGNSSLYYSKRGFANFKLNEYDLAIKDNFSALTIDNLNFEAYFHLIWIYSNRYWFLFLIIPLGLYFKREKIKAVFEVGNFYKKNTQVSIFSKVINKIFDV